jgi:hypothetical protein
LSLTRLLPLVLIPGLAAAATTVLYDPLSPTTGPFPSDLLTVPDPTQRTGLRLNLPVPDCSTQYTQCQETAVLDQSDGFSLRPRIRVRFSGPVNTATLRDGIYILGPTGRINIDQVVWDPATNTAFAKPEIALAQQTRYQLIVSDAVKDTAGASIVPNPAAPRVIIGVIGTEPPPLPPPGLVAATTFTTMSATAWLEHARDILPYVPTVVRLAEPKSSFRLADTASITLHHQTGANPVRFSDLTLPLDATLLAGLDRVVVGSFRSPRFLEDDQTIRPYPTLPALSVPTAAEEVGFNALLPDSPKPAAGYPVVIFGHGFGDSRFGGPTAVSPTLARAGFATIAITAVGHGFGQFSTVSFTDPSGKTTTLPTLGRSVDLNHDGTIEANEGCATITPVPYGLRDCFRQTVVDLMQLARVIRQGLDLDGDGTPDLDPSRIYYGGQSLGAMYGTIFTALEPNVRAAGLNVGGATALDIARFSPAYRGISTETLRLNQPGLLNNGDSFNEDYPLPGQPVRSVTLPGALAIQNAFELAEWLGISGDPISFAPALHDRRVLVQFARGDRTMPNPATTNLIRAAGLQSSTWVYRHDLARAKDPTLPLDPHPFLVLFVSLDGASIQLPSLAGLAISVDAQSQFANFFASDGRTIPDPNFLSTLLLGTKVFEVPTTLPLDLGF